MWKKYGVGRGKAAAQLIPSQPAKSELLLPLLPLLLKPLLLLTSQMATLGLTQRLRRGLGLGQGQTTSGQGQGQGLTTSGQGQGLTTSGLGGAPGCPEGRAPSLRGRSSGQSGSSGLFARPR